MHYLEIKIDWLDYNKYMVEKNKIKNVWECLYFILSIAK